VCYPPNRSDKLRTYPTEVFKKAPAMRCGAAASGSYIKLTGTFMSFWSPFVRHSSLTRLQNLGWLGSPNERIETCIDSRQEPVPGQRPLRRTQMLQLFENRASDSIGKPAAVRSALWSFIIHVGALLFVLSLGYSPLVQGLPDDLRRAALLIAPPPPSPSPPPPVTKAVVPSRRAVRVFSSKLTAPVAVPRYLADAIIEAPPEGGVVAGVPGGIPGGIAGGGLLLEIPSIAPPALSPPPLSPRPEAPPKIPQPLRPQRIKLSEGVQQAQLLEMIEPTYPLLARRARIQGTVRLRAVITTDGSVSQLEWVEGHPMLIAAAIEAVSKWRYRPTLLSGEAVEVATEITVNFKLSAPTGRPTTWPVSRGGYMTLPLFTTFCLLATATLGLALHRMLIVRLKEDECLHVLDSDVPLIDKQKAAARRLKTVDVWGKTLTILTILSGIAAYGAWWMGA
jgi:protein TonB